MRLRMYLLAACSVYSLPAQTWMEFGIKAGVRRVEVQRGTPAKALRTDRAHRMLRYPQAPGLRERREAERLGFEVLQFVPGNGLLVSMPAESAAIPLHPRFPEVLELTEKISPLMGEGRHAIVEFFRDVPLWDRDWIVRSEGLTMRPHLDLHPHQMLVEGSPEQLRSLSAWDEVSYIFPASVELIAGESVRACAGAVTELGPVGQYISKIGQGWDGQGLNAATLRYWFSTVSTKLAAETMKTEFRRALGEWSKAVQVDFLEGGISESPKHLNVVFSPGAHGDAYPFDGPGQMLAHTFFPSPPNPEPIAGDLHFDDGESWKIGADVDFYSVALHEIGHGLGLGHSDNPNDVMYAYYRRSAQLSAGDIAAIREMYAARTAPEPAPAPGPQPAPPPANPAPAPEPPKPEPPKPQPPPVDPPKEPAPDTVAPTLAVTWPAASSVLTQAPSITMRGSASDNVGVARVGWSSNIYSGGVAEGTNDWSVTVPLITGTNRVTVRAFDAAGNAAARTITVTKR